MTLSLEPSKYFFFPFFNRAQDLICQELLYRCFNCPNFTRIAKVPNSPIVKLMRVFNWTFIFRIDASLQLNAISIFSFQKISVHLNLENFPKNKEVFDTKEDVYGLLLGGETNSTFLKINLNSLKNAEMYNAKDVQQTSRAHQRELLLLSSVSTHRDRKLWI